MILFYSKFIPEFLQPLLMKIVGQFDRLIPSPYADEIRGSYSRTLYSTISNNFKLTYISSKQVYELKYPSLSCVSHVKIMLWHRLY